MKLDEDVDGMPLETTEEKQPKGGFVPSKWETIDKTELEAQGDQLYHVNSNSGNSQEFALTDISQHELNFPFLLCSHDDFQVGFIGTGETDTKRRRRGC